MEVPWKIGYAAQRLKDGYRVNRITVRDFLRHFGAERRGAVKVQEIRNILDELGLKTDPDFETIWIDAPIWLQLKGSNSSDEREVPFSDETSVDGSSAMDDDIILEGTPSSVAAAQVQAKSAPVSDEPETPALERNNDGASGDDPTFRIGSLPAANKTLIVVNQDDQLSRAITLMLEHDFSQLPVMQGERDVKGMVTWKSIVKKGVLGGPREYVRDCREDVRIVDSDRTLFAEIPTIVEYGYVLVRNSKDRKITGIVTASDLSLQFQTLAEPFLLLREIELHVRKLLAAKVPLTQFEILPERTSIDKKPQSVSDLTFGEYVRLIQHPEIWRKLDLNIDSQVFTALLDDVRNIRNDVMHFDPDPMTDVELNTLKRAARFMQQLADLSQQ